MAALFCLQGVFACGETDDQIQVVGLNLGLVGGAAAGELTALFASMDDHVAFFGVRLGTYGAKRAAAVIGAVPLLRWRRLINSPINPHLKIHQQRIYT